MDVFALDQADRETLQTLAVACGAVRPDTSLALDATRLRRILDAVARLSRALGRESNATRAWTIAIAGLRDTVAVGDVKVKVFMRDGDTMPVLLEDERNSDQADRNLHPRSSIAVPIAANGKMHGVIQIDSPEVDAFTIVDATIAATIGDQLAMALLPA